MNRSWRAVIIGLGVLGAMSWAEESFAAPVYIGLQESGVNGGGISDQGNADGSFSIVNTNYGNFTVLNASGTGSPDLTEPNFDSASLSISSSSANSSNPLNIYLSILNQNVLPPAYSSTFTSNNLPAGWTLMESTFVTACGTSCSAANAFATANLLSTTTFTSTGTVTQVAGNPLPSGPYVTTELYTITSNGVTGNAENATIDLSAATATPLPSTWTMLIATLLGIGWFAHRGPKMQALRIGRLDAAAAA